MEFLEVITIDISDTNAKGHHLSCHPSNFKVKTWQEITNQLWLKFSVSGLEPEFEFTDDFEMVHEA